MKKGSKKEKSWLNPTNKIRESRETKQEEVIEAGKAFIDILEALLKKMELLYLKLGKIKNQTNNIMNFLHNF